MKIFICLLALVCVCNGTLLNLLGASSGGSDASKVTYNVVATPTHVGGGGGQDHGHSHGHGYASSHGGSYAHSYGYSHDHGHGHGHGHGGSTQVIKVILDHSSAGHSYGGGYASGHSYESYGHDHGHGHGHGHGHDHGHDHSHGHGGDAQIFKVITETASGHAPIHVDHGYSVGSSGGWHSASSYASGYGHGGSYSVNSQLGAILPQILQLVLQEDAVHGSGGGFISSIGGGGGGGFDLNSQIIANFGHKGSAVVNRSDGKKSNSFYSGGHVIQKGVLKVMRVEGAPTAAHPAPVYSHPPVHHAPHPPPPHGW